MPVWRLGPSVSIALLAHSVSHHLNDIFGSQSHQNRSRVAFKDIKLLRHKQHKVTSTSLSQPLLPDLATDTDREYRMHPPLRRHHDRERPASLVPSVTVATGRLKKKDPPCFPDLFIYKCGTSCFFFSPADEIIK